MKKLILKIRLKWYRFRGKSYTEIMEILGYKNKLTKLQL